MSRRKTLVKLLSGYDMPYDVKMAVLWMVRGYGNREKDESIANFWQAEFKVIENTLENIPENLQAPILAKICDKAKYDDESKEICTLYENYLLYTVAKAIKAF